MLFIDKLTTPKGIERSEPEQQRVDEVTKNMVLYQFKTCPFCMKVRREIKRQSLNIELRDAQHNQEYRAQLQKGGGQVKVPCLRNVNDQGEETWLYESDQIIDYLKQKAA
ncbi:MAG: glutathione S-transferase N-terminal domain-containing protein [Gammaproteobacteria bacterium]